MMLRRTSVLPLSTAAWMSARMVSRTLMSGSAGIVASSMKSPNDPAVCPGHQYSKDPSAPLSTVRENNVVFRPRSLQEWQQMFGA
jgi:hypothetical protein